MSSNYLPTDYQTFIATSRYARWLEEVSASNRPNIHDLNAPMPGISTFSYGSNQKMSKIPRDRWSNVRSKNQEILQARFAAYHM